MYFLVKKMLKYSFGKLVYIKQYIKMYKMTLQNVKQTLHKK